MPEVPRSLGPQVRTAPLPAPLANPGMARPDAFGASIAEGLQRGAAVAYAAQQKAEEDRDDTEAVDATNQLMEWEGQETPKWLGRTGKNARGVSQEASASYLKRRDEIASKLTSPGAKQRFVQMSDARLARQLSGRLAAHEEAQLRDYEVDTYNGQVKNLHRDALSVGTSEAVDEADRLSTLTLYRLADLTGADPQSTENAIRTQRETLHGAFIESAIDAEDWQASETALAKYGPSLPADKRAGLERRVRDGSMNQRAQDTADTIFRSGYAATKADADKMVAQIPDADLRGRTQTKVDQEWSRRQAALAEARGSSFERIAKAVDAGEDVESLLVRDPDAASLEQIDKDRLRNVARNAAERRAPPSGSDEFYFLRNAAAAQPEAFIAEDLRRYRGVISEPERQRLMELQADMREAGRVAAGRPPKPARGILTAEEVANDVLDSIGINPHRVDGKIDPRAKAFKAQLDRAIIADGGTDNLDSEAVRKIADRLVLEETRAAAAGPIGKTVNFLGLGLPGMIAGIGVDGTHGVRAFEAPGADRRAFTMSQIPAADLPRIVQSLVKQGMDPKRISEDDILTTYNAAISKAAP